MMSETKHTRFELWFNEWGWLWFFLIPVFFPAIPLVWISGGSPFYETSPGFIPLWVTEAIVLFVFVAIMKHRYTLKEKKIQEEEWGEILNNSNKKKQ